MSKPTVTVLMTVFNNGPFLTEAIEGVLSQTYKDFEFLIIDDGSTDKSPRILQDYAKKDKRIKVISQANKGLVASLNLGIKLASGKYIARQDADDRSEPDRFKKQQRFLESHPDVTVVGSSITVMDSTSNIMHQHTVLLHDPELRQELLIRSPFAHGSVMYRRSAAVEAGLYDEASWPAEDYDLWLRLSAHGQLANLDEYLYDYREHNQSISEKNAKLQQKKLTQVQAKAWREHGRLLPKKKIDLKVYQKLDMGQHRIERIIDNTVFISKTAWRHNQKSLAFKNMSTLGGDRMVYKKAAGKIKRRVERK